MVNHCWLSVESCNYAYLCLLVCSFGDLEVLKCLGYVSWMTVMTIKSDYKDGGLNEESCIWVFQYQDHGGII